MSRPKHTVVNPDGLAPPRGYSHGVLAAPGRTLYVAGQIGWDKRGRLVGLGFLAQFEQALANVVQVARAAGGDAGSICRLTIYVADKADYLSDTRAVGEAYRKHLGRWYPAMSLVEVGQLLEPGARVEIEATCVIADEPPFAGGHFEGGHP